MSTQTSLRPLQTDDADTLFALIDGCRDALSPWLPWAEISRSAGDAPVFIRRTLAERDSGRALTWLADAYVGRGYLPQALSQRLHTAFAELGLKRVDIISAAPNLRVRDRFWDARIFSLLAADRRAARESTR